MGGGSVQPENLCATFAGNSVRLKPVSVCGVYHKDTFIRTNSRFIEIVLIDFKASLVIDIAICDPGSVDLALKHFKQHWNILHVFSDIPYNIHPLSNFLYTRNAFFIKYCFNDCQNAPFVINYCI